MWRDEHIWEFPKPNFLISQQIILAHYMRLFILWDDFIGELHVFVYVSVRKNHPAWCSCKVNFQTTYRLFCHHLDCTLFDTKGLGKASEYISSWYCCLPTIFLLVPVPIVNHLIKALDFNSPILVLVHTSVLKCHQLHYYIACLLNYILHHTE